MKIVYGSISVIPSREANSIHVMKMCDALSLDNSVYLVTPDKGQEKNNQLKQYYNIKKDFPIIYLDWPRRFRFKAIRYARKIVRFAKQEKADLIFSRDVSCSFVAAIMGIDTIWESHMPIDTLGHFCERQFILLSKSTHFQKLVVISNNLKNYYINNYKIPANKIIVSPDGANILPNDILIFSEIRDEKRFNVGYTGHLYPGKGMEIISQLVYLCPDVHFHIFGGMEKDINYWKEQLKDYKNVTFYGFIEHSEIPSYAMTMDALIAPYLSKVSGAGEASNKGRIGEWMSPLKLFEYMSYKKPIICSDLQVLKDVMIDGSNCVMCNPNIIEEWIKKIELLRDNKDYAENLADQAYKNLCEKYTWEKRAQNIVECLK